MTTLGKVIYNNPPQERWLHTMTLHPKESCPTDRGMCLTIWDDGEVHTKCRYARLTTTNPDMAQITQTGKYVGMRCIPSQAMDFILSDD